MNAPDETRQQHRWDDDEWGGDDDEPLPDTRSGARRLALQALYWELASAANMGTSNVEFAGQLARVCIEHGTELHDLITAAATNWHPDRIARLDGLILRLALTELLYIEGVPAKVTIHEAIELAKSYGGDKSHAFVNGILDAITRQRGLQL
jgi:N utilization substance protein B